MHKYTLHTFCHYYFRRESFDAKKGQNFGIKCIWFFERLSEKHLYGKIDSDINFRDFSFKSWFSLDYKCNQALVKISFITKINWKKLALEMPIESAIGIPVAPATPCHRVYRVAE